MVKITVMEEQIRRNLLVAKMLSIHTRKGKPWFKSEMYYIVNLENDK